MPTTAGLLFALALSAASIQQKPEWCRNLPRPEYQKLERIAAPDPWFEVYKIRRGVFAIYEPHQQLAEIPVSVVLGAF